MDDVHQRVLAKCYNHILMELDYNLVCAHLILYGVLSWKLHHVIDQRPNNRLKAKALLAILPRRGPLAFQRFMSALDKADYVWLVEDINRALYDVYTETESSSSDAALSS